MYNRTPVVRVMRKPLDFKGRGKLAKKKLFGRIYPQMEHKVRRPRDRIAEFPSEESNKEFYCAREPGNQETKLRKVGEDDKTLAHLVPGDDNTKVVVVKKNQLGRKPVFVNLVHKTGRGLVRRAEDVPVQMRHVLSAGKSDMNTNVRLGGCCRREIREKQSGENRIRAAKDSEMVLGQARAGNYQPME